MSMCRVLCCWKKVFAMTSAFSWQNSISLCPASFRTPRPNLPVTPWKAAMDCAEVHGLGWTAQKHGREELPLTQVQGRQRRGATPWPRSGVAAESTRLHWRRSGREELPHIRGQGPRPRGATPRSRSGGAAVRRYPSSKVRSSGCALLEWLWRDTPCPR